MGVYLVSQLLNGLIFGLIYCLIALGLTVVFSIMRVINFAEWRELDAGAIGGTTSTRPAGFWARRSS